MFMAWIAILILGIILMIIWAVGKEIYYSSKKEKVICPTCGRETLRKGTKFACESCLKPIIMHADGTPRQC